MRCGAVQPTAQPTSRRTRRSVGGQPSALAVAASSAATSSSSATSTSTGSSTWQWAASADPPIHESMHACMHGLEGLYIGPSSLLVLVLVLAGKLGVSHVLCGSHVAVCGHPHRGFLDKSTALPQCCPNALSQVLRPVRSTEARAAIWSGRAVTRKVLAGVVPCRPWPATHPPASTRAWSRTSRGSKPPLAGGETRPPSSQALGGRGSGYEEVLWLQAVCGL